MIVLAPSRSTAPASALLTLEDAKTHLRVDDDVDDALIDGLIGAATDLLDGYSGILGRALITQTWRQSFSAFPVCGEIADRFRLPLGPLRAVTSIKYYDALDVEQDFTEFTAVSDALGPMVVLNYGSWWPITAIRPDAVTVTWTCGYGDSAADVPAPIIHAAKLLVGDWYDNRDDTAIGQSIAPSVMPNGVRMLLAPYRKVGL